MIGIEAMIKEQLLLTTVVQKPNQGTQPENGPCRPELDEGSGRLFSCPTDVGQAGVPFFGEAKKYEEWLVIF